MILTRHYMLDDLTGDLVGRSDSGDRRFSKAGRRYKPQEAIYRTPAGLRSPAELQEAVQAVAIFADGEEGPRRDLARRFLAAAAATH